MNFISGIKFQDPVIVPWSIASAKGFLCLGHKYINYSELSPGESAVYRLSAAQKTIGIIILFILIVGFIMDWKLTLIVLLAILTTIYFVDLFFDLYIIIKSFLSAPEIHISDEELAALKDKELPTYTIISPLYKEAAILPQFINAMSSLTYPKKKLQVIMVIEEDDRDTIHEFQKHTLPSNFSIAVVPHSIPKTKPKALNFGLTKATGKYVVVYDAEDIPERNQLKKAVIAFQKSDPNVKCIQAKLDYYNPHESLLTRLFTAEYALWFDVILPGIQSISGPIPLGGTSNHFERKYLEEIKAWDSFNVTEDCDLGIRLAKRGHHTAIIESRTYEQATKHPRGWFWQRTRWLKGYMQTYMVHMRRPGEFIDSEKRSNLVTFQLIVGGKIALMFINPIMWILTICYFILRNQIGSQYGEFFPLPVLYMGLFSLLIGNFLYLYYYLVGALKREYWSIASYILLVPFYWLFLSMAAYVSLYKLITEPHFWAKTTHSLTVNNLADMLSYEKYKSSKFE